MMLRLDYLLFTSTKFSFDSFFLNAVAARQSEKADVSCEWKAFSVRLFSFTTSLRFPAKSSIYILREYFGYHFFCAQYISETCCSVVSPYCFFYCSVTGTLKESRLGFFAHHFLLSWMCLHLQQKQSNSLVKEWICDIQICMDDKTCAITCELLLGSCKIMFRVNRYLNSLGRGLVGMFL